MSIKFKEEFDIDGLRERLRNVTDARLLRSGKAAKFMCSPGANFGKLPRDLFRDSIEGGKSRVEAEE